MKKTLFFLLAATMFLGCTLDNDFGNEKSNPLVLTVEYGSDNNYEVNSYILEDGVLDLIHSTNLERSLDFQPYGDDFIYLHTLYEGSGFDEELVGFKFAQYNPFDGVTKEIADLGDDKLISKWKPIPQGIVVATRNSNYEEDRDYALELIDYSTGVMTKLADIELENSDINPYNFADFYMSEDGDKLFFIGEDVMGHFAHLIEYSFSDTELTTKELFDFNEHFNGFSTRGLCIKDRVLYFDLFSFDSWQSDFIEFDLDTLDEKVTETDGPINSTYCEEDYILIVNQTDPGHAIDIMRDGNVEYLVDGYLEATMDGYLVRTLGISSNDDRALYDISSGISTTIPTDNHINSVHLIGY